MDPTTLLNTLCAGCESLLEAALQHVPAAERARAYEYHYLFRVFPASGGGAVQVRVFENDQGRDVGVVPSARWPQGFGEKIAECDGLLLHGPKLRRIGWIEDKGV